MSYPQSTAYTAVFKAYLASDHVTAATGKTIAITISKAGGAFGNPSAGASNATEISGGWYSFAFSTTDTGTLGDLVLKGAEASIDTVERIFPIVDARNGGLTALPAVASGTTGGVIVHGTGTTGLNTTSGKAPATIAAGDLANSSITAAAIADNAIDTATFAAGTTIPRVTLVDTTTTNTDMRGTDNALLASSYAAPDNANIGVAATQTTAANIRAAVGLAAADLDTKFSLLATAANLATLAGKFTGITLLAQWLGAMAGKQAGNATALTEIRATGAGSGMFDPTTDSEEAIRDRGDAAWITGGSGTGSLTVPVHVTDDSSADVVGKVVTVRLSGSTIDISQPTDADGLTSVSLNPADNYEFIVPGGNQFSGSSTLVDVSDATQVEVEVVRVVITPSIDPQTTCYLTVLDNAGQPKQSIPVELRITGFATGATGTGVSVQTSKGVTDSNGLVQFIGQPQGATYSVTVNGGEPVKGVTGSTTTTAMVNALGVISVAG